MASNTVTSETKLMHYLDLTEYGFNDVPDERKQDAKEEVSSYLVNETLRFLSKGTSPVKGEGRFRILNSKYAKTQKGGVKTANLELEGDLKDSLISKPAEGAFIKFGHKGTQVPKADGHNQLSSKAQTWAVASGMPKRRYIPSDGQKFVSEITEEIEAIINDFKPTISTEEVDIDINLFLGKDKGTISETTENESQSNVGIDDLFSDDLIEDLLLNAIRRGN
jgi:hypothetical protein